MTLLRSNVWITVVAVCALVLPILSIAASSARAGAFYDCELGDVHQFFDCVDPEKPPPQPCQPTAGNPVDVLTGRKHQDALDWSSGGLHPLELRRSYSSSPFILMASPYSSVGRGWRTNFDARARWKGSTLAEADWVHIVLPDHFEYHFNKQAGAWKAMAPQSGGGSVYVSSVVWKNRTDLDASLRIDGEWIVLRTPDDTEYVFDSAEHKPDSQWVVDGLHTSVLAEIRFRGGYAQKLIYSGDYLVRVSDNQGRWIDMTYSRVSFRSRYISEVRTMDGSSIRYSYENRFPAYNPGYPNDFWALSAVTYPDSTPAADDNPKVRYEYADAVGKPGLLLTGIVDERGVRFASWTYDSKRRVLTSQHAGGADLWQFSYNDAGKSVSVTNPLGRITKYSYQKGIGGIRQLTAVDGIATSNCAASNTQYSYDANGFRSQAQDAEGRVTKWQRDARGLPLSITEGAGSGAERTSSMTWNASRPWPASAAQPGLNTAYQYRPSGSVSQILQTDGSTASKPYATAGQKRETNYAYTAFKIPYSGPPGPSGPALADVPLPIVNATADNGDTGWTSIYDTVYVLSGTTVCPASNPCFVGGWNGSVVYQDVAIPSANIAEIDSGRRAARFGWRQWGNSDRSDLGGDYSAAGLVFLSGSGATLGSVAPPIRKYAGWRNLSAAAPIPAGTRTIRVMMLMHSFIHAGNGIVDDLSLTLVADGSAAADPFLKVKNPSAISGTTEGWTVRPGQSGVVAASGWGYPGYTRFANQSPTGNSGVDQLLDIPSDRYAEIDAGKRGLEMTWTAYANSTSADVGLSVEAMDAAGKLIGELGYFSSSIMTEWDVAQKSRILLIPAGTRRLNVIMETKFPEGQGGSASWRDVTMRLVASPAPVSSSLDLLTAIDGPLPGPSDTVRYAYDAAGKLASVTNELGHVTRITARDTAGRPLSITDPNGVVTAMAYDPRGRLATVTVNPGAAQARTLIAYDAAGQVTRVTAPDGSYLNYAWSDARRLAAVSNNAGERIEYGYNANGDQTSRTVKSASGAILRQQSALFDELGRLMRSIGAAGQQSSFRYDRTDNLTEVKDPRGGLFAYAYDGLQNLTSLTDQAGGSVKLTRDGQGEVTAYRDPRGLATAYVRNGFGDIIQESGPDTGTTVIVRDARGLATKITDPRGAVTKLAYDAAGRLISETYPADPTQNVTYFYDATANGNKGIGRLTGITDASGSLARYYDALGRVTAETRTIAGKSYTLAYAYNAAGRLTSLTYPSGRVVSFTRDALGRVTAVSTKATATASQQTVASGIAWSPMSSLLTSLTHGNGLAATRAYDGDGRLASLKLNNGATRLADLSYAYGDGMNLTAVNDNLAAANSVALAYDAAQRLAYAKGPWGTLTYGYTPNGDRSKEVLTPPSGGGALTTVLNYPATSNRLASTSVGSFTTRSFTY
ncbi:MAG: RHS repeat protein, partial [Aestuariivirga sp.]|uniref:DUF6531 domain-containing protein n=1 Tax=Aestuariivirga sp. TaxID=2650926 RepID=UPI0025C6827C